MAGHQMLCYQFILYYQVTYSILADAATMDTGIALVQLGWWRPAGMSELSPPPPFYPDLRHSPSLPIV